MSKDFQKAIWLCHQALYISKVRKKREREIEKVNHEYLIAGLQKLG